MSINNFSLEARQYLASLHSQPADLVIELILSLEGQVHELSQKVETGKRLLIEEMERGNERTQLAIELRGQLHALRTELGIE